MSAAKSQTGSGVRAARLVVLGDPISHSLSPALHAALAESSGREVDYRALRVRPAELGGAISGLRSAGFQGVNLTLPHKRAVMEHVGRLEGDAIAAGAVNTLVLSQDSEEGWIGHNTDVEGLRRALPENMGDAHVLVVGAGGAARGAVLALARWGAARISVAARRESAAAELVGDLAPVVPSRLDAQRLAGDLYQRLGATHETGTSSEGPGVPALLVDATSCGVGAQLDQSPWPKGLRFPPWVVDLVYGARPTPLLAAAAEQGCRVRDGLGMLVWQGALAFDLWFGAETARDAVVSPIETRLREMIEGECSRDLVAPAEYLAGGLENEA